MVGRPGGFTYNPGGKGLHECKRKPKVTCEGVMLSKQPVKTACSGKESIELTSASDRKTSLRRAKNRQSRRDDAPEGFGKAHSMRYDNRNLSPSVRQCYVRGDDSASFLNILHCIALREGLQSTFSFWLHLRFVFCCLCYTIPRCASTYINRVYRCQGHPEYLHGTG
jgi:hypothetical protein